MGIADYFTSTPLLAVMDSWFGNEGLWKPVRRGLGERFDILSRLRSNNVLYAVPDAAQSGQRGRRRKYGQRLGSTADMAARSQGLAMTYSVHLYGKHRDVRAYDQIVMLKTLKCPVRVVWVFRKTQWVALFTTDLALSVTQIIEYYGARWIVKPASKSSSRTSAAEPVSAGMPTRLSGGIKKEPHKIRQLLPCRVRTLMTAPSKLV